MTIIAGSVQECSIKSRIFQVPADTDVKLKLGGKTNEGIPLGSGRSYVKQTAMVGEISGLIVALDHDNDDLQFLQDIANGGGFVPVTVTFADGNTFAGNGQIGGDLEGSTDKSSVELKLFAETVFAKQ